MLWRSCHRAECSLSTGRICPGPALAITSSPAATRLSLFARARILPAMSVARVARRPAAPTTALSTTDASVASATSADAREPSMTVVPLGASTPPSVRPSRWTSNSFAWARRVSASELAVRAVTRKRPGCARTTSRAWVPIEPVEHPAVPEQDRPQVLEPEVTLQHGLEEVAQGSHDADEGAKHGCLAHVPRPDQRRP